MVRDLQQLTVNVFQMQGGQFGYARCRWFLMKVQMTSEPTASLGYTNLEDGVPRLSGSASDVGGVVASVEVSWSRALAHRRAR